MFELEYSGQFKKDLKLMLKRGADIEDIRIILHMLETDGQVADSYRPHTPTELTWRANTRPTGD